MTDDWADTNRAWWDERAPLHERSEFYDLDGFVEHPDRLRPYEVDDLGDVTGLSLLHLQCHLGTDTLSWATRGARVVGLDFSGPAIDAARRLAARLAYDDGRAEFLHANVYDAVEAVGGRRFDVVYTGFGALTWLDDLQRWADVATSLVVPGGRLYVAEMHPITWVFSDDDLSIEYDYWSSGIFEADGSYVDRAAPLATRKTAERNATIGEVVTAVAERGLVVRSLREHPTTVFQRWPWMETDDRHAWRQPYRQPRIPLVWTLLASKPPLDE